MALATANFFSCLHVSQQCRGAGQLLRDRGVNGDYFLITQVSRILTERRENEKQGR